VHRNAVGELRGVMEREKAPLAVMITLREPTAPMIKEAASAGFFDTPFGRFPRMQVVSVAKLLDGKLPKLPPQERGGGFRQAARGPATETALGRVLINGVCPAISRCRKLPVRCCRKFRRSSSAVATSRAGHRLRGLGRADQRRRWGRGRQRRARRLHQLGRW
jgi:hypothetical protein